MDKSQASTILNQLLKSLHEKGGIQVTPQEFEQVVKAVSYFTEDKVKPEKQTK